MMTLAANKQNLYYALVEGIFPVYELDENGNRIIDYVDEDGNKYYRETGEKEIVYSKPVPFKANISMSSGEAYTQEFGIDISQYDAVLVMDKDKVPIDETSILWHESQIKYKDASETHPDPFSADFKVSAIKPSLNQLKVLLKAITK